VERFESDGPAATESLGSRIASRVGAGDLVHVVGDLGAGKTTLVRGACHALGVSGPVTSPTFATAHRYSAAAGLVVAHLDLYRLRSLADEDPDLFADYLGPDVVTFVEWPPEGAVSDLGAPAMTVTLTHRGGDQRLIEVRP
jgi:tRNA threonylcarbamoyladenosine biosynthesis protein TsaE